eukprot:TRINITY_DN17842_c0_g1_i1.p1 TRINITY_DN17842_c0_g1~~TRINITY_DN17842_c0_g1_i1.p1  ORF type:complete len:566 (+),score=114.17 TRINITY_DN17842_c0_g1_i1:61-1758(+)
METSSLSSSAVEEYFESQEHPVTMDVEVARQIQQLLANQLEQVKRALACNEEIANRLAGFAGTSPSTTQNLVEDAARIAFERRAEAELERTRSRRATAFEKLEKLEVTRNSRNSCGSETDMRKKLSIDTNDLTVPLINVISAEDDACSEPPSPAPVKRKINPTFADVESIKIFLQNTLTQKHYNVEDLYHESGWAREVATNSTFKNITMLVIFCNTLWIAYDTDNNDAEVLTDAKPIFQIAENMFCSFFTFEVMTRFFAFATKCNALKDGWFMFDSLLVIMMVWETWVVPCLYLMMSDSSAGGNSTQNSSILRIMRLFRLFRASRVLRLLRSFPELMILVQAMMAAMRSVVGTMTLLILVVYIFAILFTQLLKGSPTAAGCFETVPQSVNCLLLNSVFPDQKDLFELLLTHNIVFYFINLLFMSLSCLMVMNLLIGLLCEVVSEVSRVEKDSLLAFDLQQSLLEAMPLIDEDGNRQISVTEFKQIFENDKACKILNEVGVDVFALVDNVDYIFDGASYLSFGDFVDMALKFRHDNNVTVKELATARMVILQELKTIEANLKKGKQ